MKLSPWHSGKVKPVHVGIYERMIGGFVAYSHWNGKRWGITNDNINVAHRLLNLESEYQNNLLWRGIVK